MEPVVNQVTSRLATPSGSPKKNGDSHSSVVSSHQRKMPPKRSSSREATITPRLRGSRASTRITLQDLPPQHLPDRGVQLQEPLRHADLSDLAGPLQVDLELCDGVRRRPGGEHDHPVGQRDRLRSWVTKTTDFLSADQSCSSSSSMSCRVWMSRALKGSSMRRMRGSSASAWASPARFLMPPESWCGYFLPCPSRPTRTSHSRAIPRAFALSIPWKSKPAAML